MIEDARVRWGLAALLFAGVLMGMTAPSRLPAGCRCVRRLRGGPPCWLTPGGRVARGQALAPALGALAIFALDVHYWAGSPCRAYKAAEQYGLDMVTASDRALMVRRAFSNT